MSKEIAKVIINELVPRLNKKGLSIKDSPISPYQINLLVRLKTLNLIDHKTLRKVLDNLMEEV